MKVIMKLCLFVIVTLISFSCTFYYKTADLDANLKKAVSQVNSNSDDAKTKIETTKKEFYAMKCNSTDPIVQKAKDYLVTLENEMKEIQQIKATVNEEYDIFLKYSKGKSQIQSNSEEWKKLKQTKKIVKSSSKDFIRKGKKLSKIASDFTAFTSTELKSIQFVDVISYNKKFEELQENIVKQEKELFVQLTKQESDVVELISKKSDSNVEKCQLLKDDLTKISLEKQKITSLSPKIGQSIASFKSASKGFSRIYSCSIEWEIVKKTETSLNEHQLELQAIINELSQIKAHMQEVITSMN
jgi:hypothetical protein